MREILMERFRARPFPARFAVALMDKFHHFFERCTGEKNFFHAFAFHNCGVALSDGAAAAAANPDVACAFFSQQIDNSPEASDLPAVITGNPDGSHVVLDRAAHEVPPRPATTEITRCAPV